MSEDQIPVQRLAQAHVLVLGDVMLDRYICGIVERISPEAPVPVLRRASERAMSGVRAMSPARPASASWRSEAAGISSGRGR
jgi:bifunctional ADP-heptose synthase (sugar kinase/adenylyltransferase)